MVEFEDDENLVKGSFIPSLKKALHRSCSVFEQFSLHETTIYQRGESLERKEIGKESIKTSQKLTI